MSTMKETEKNKSEQIIYSILILIFLLGAATGIGYIFRHAGFPETNIVIVYILSVIIGAMFTSAYVVDVAASLAATLTFNFFFTEPYFTFSVNDPGYIITFIIMIITALITSALTSKVKKSAYEATVKKNEADALYKFTNRLTEAQDIESIAHITVTTLSDVMKCNTACLCFDGSGIPQNAFWQQNEMGKPIRKNIENTDEIKKRMDNLHTAYDIGDEFYDFPVYGRNATLGIIRIPAERASRLDESQMRILQSMIENTALAMDRFYIAREQEKTRGETERERYRGNLLRAISHDLRTPLAGILGSSQMLRDVAADKDAVIRIAEDIREEADWLHALVENILNMTRLQDGKLLPQKEPEAVEEVIGFAVATISRRYPGAEIAVSAPDELLVVPMDARLISQVLINLLDNAVRHSRDRKGIAISVSATSDFARITVSDSGLGLREEDLPHIFDMFYKSDASSSDAKHGIGIGLAICKAIIEAHGGGITARNKAGGHGAEFVFTLPA